MIHAPPERESKIQRSGIIRLRRLGVMLFRRNVGAMADQSGNHVRFAAAGQSDTYGWVIATGRHIELEWKRPGNKPTAHQLRWLKACSESGAIAFWADSVHIAELVMSAILEGGEIVWRDGCDYDVVINSPSSQLPPEDPPHDQTDASTSD
jgi:hypothetical protein